MRKPYIIAVVTVFLAVFAILINNKPKTDKLPSVEFSGTRAKEEQPGGWEFTSPNGYEEILKNRNVVIRHYKFHPTMTAEFLADSIEKEQFEGWLAGQGLLNWQMESVNSSKVGGYKLLVTLDSPETAQKIFDKAVSAVFVGDDGFVAPEPKTQMVNTVKSAYEEYASGFILAVKVQTDINAITRALIRPASRNRTMQLEESVVTLVSAFVQVASGVAPEGNHRK